MVLPRKVQEILERTRSKATGDTAGGQRPAEVAPPREGVSVAGKGGPNTGPGPKAKKKRKRKTRRMPERVVAAPSRCRDCGREARVSRFAYFKASKPRCVACGGLPERVVAAPSRCRDCGREARVSRFAYFKASKPRCVACGGLPDYLGSWHKTR